MKGSGHNSFLASAALIGAPVALLLVIGLAGLATMRKAVLADAGAEAQERVDRFARSVADFSSPGDGVPLTLPVRLPIPPDEPGPDAGALAAAIEAGDTGELRRLGREGKGLSGAGLPVRTLASIALLKAGAKIDTTAASDLWPVENPSMLTEMWVEGLEKAAGGNSEGGLGDLADSARARWERDERIREAFWDARSGEWSKDFRGGLHVIDGNLFQVLKRSRGTDGSVHVMTGDEVLRWLEETTGGNWGPYPKWMEVSATAGGMMIGGYPQLDWLDAPPEGERMGVATNGPFTFIATLKSPDVLFAPTNATSNLVRWMMVIAAVSTTAGLFFAYRSLCRERRLNELKSQFVSSVSHELRAPVGSLRLMADALDQETVSGAKAREFHRLMSREGARLSAMIENVLDFARIEQGKKTYKLSETDIEKLVRETVQLMAPIAGEKDVRIKTEIDAPAKPPVVDADAVQQALINLVDNAVKFSPEGETVTVTFSEDEKNRDWVLSVADRGPGIPESSRMDVFERFHRLGNELRRETQGAGIGLSLVKHVAEGHGGSVKVTGDSPGATLELRIPVTANGTPNGTSNAEDGNP